jgi:antitoxin component YwqK of YwqJK toxin-antitoxin module
MKLPRRYRMKYTAYTIIAATALMACSCQKNKKDDEVISQSYVHKYGYALSQEEWQEKNYPGQVISSLKNGVTITATYENGELQGPCTFTYPYSHTVEKYILYNKNDPVKEISYDITGMPVQEIVQLTDSTHSVTSWYTDGVPKSVEEYAQDELINGQYFTTSHEVEARVEKGNGSRIIREVTGTLLCKDAIENGMLKRRESFFANGSPESIADYAYGQLHGTRKSFTSMGEPLAVEEWENGHLHGTSCYYKNGRKELEVTYLYGKKNGLETHFTDGEKVSHQITWILGLKHGPETFFLANTTKTLWHYDNKEITEFRFKELSSLDAIISESMQ